MSLVTANEVATFLSVAPGRVYELARQGMIPSIRVGRQLRFSMPAIERWAEQGGKAFDGGWRRESDRSQSAA